MLRWGGAEILCVCSWGFHKSVRSRGRAFRKIWPVLLALQPDHGILVKKNQKSTLRLYYDNRASPVSWDPSIEIPGCRDPGRKFFK